MKRRFILAIDQGTSGTKTLIFDEEGKIVSKAKVGLKCHYPQVGFVEQDPQEIYRSVLDSVKLCLRGFSGKISSCGIANQRETFLLWEKSGKPITDAIVWQCKRSVGVCERLKKACLEEEINRRTGLIIDPYFSGTKLIWLYENDASVKDAFDRGSAYFGTIDTWLLYRLTGGEEYRTDFSNASRTLFFNINTLDWDETLLKRFNLNNLRLPEVHPCSFHYGETDFEGILPYSITISSMIGDSHAAAFGEGCYSSGMAKATLGTGSSILMNIENLKIKSRKGMATTICWSTQDRVDFAFEGIIVTAGATIQWLQDNLGILSATRETVTMAESVKDSQGVYFIPAFSGMGAPYWKMNAKAAILNLTFGSNKNHIVRAALESIPYQIKDVVSAMEEDSGKRIKEMKVDGGISTNRFVVQFLADLLNVPVINLGMEEVSALGAAFLAGIEAGIFKNIEQLESLNFPYKIFSPGKEKEKVMQSYEGWRQSIGKYLEE